jgi:hypothetical protein
VKNDNYKALLPKDFPKELIKLAYNLEPIGIAEIAWKSKDIIKVVDFFVDKGYAILGGDVYSLNGKELESTYDNWYINNPLSQSLLEESRKKACKYIDEHVKNNGDYYVYSIVFELV